MKQFLLRERPDDAGIIRLRGEDYHYLIHVRRLAPGDSFQALLPRSGQGETAVMVKILRTGGGVLEGELSPDMGRMPETAGSSPGKARPEDSRQAEDSREAIPPLYLFQSLAKGSRMDLIVRQAAEGGIAEVVPFISAHTVPRAASLENREERWRRIIRETRQQSGSPVDTRIRSPLSLDELLLYWEELRKGADSALGIVFHEKPVTEGIFGKDPSLPLEQGSFHHYLNRVPSLAAMAVGPEGGFSPAEIRRFMDAGFKPLWMGNTVLRTETAALYGAAAVRIILMEKKWWMLKQEPRRG
jgi:16S rRNA (uracil1498-N3)-methyltransferase